jgi:DUF1016 N-terminal domain
MAKRRQPDAPLPSTPPGYGALVSGISHLLDAARRAAARTVNNILTATYWGIGRRIVEFEQRGQARAQYGEALLKRLAQDLTARHGRGFGVVNLSQMRKFYQLWPAATILQTPSETLLPATVLTPHQPPAFPLPWSHYVRLMAVENPHARRRVK